MSQHRNKPFRPLNQPPQGVMVRQEVTAIHGPLPPPEDFQRYNEILPNAAERIVASWERESAFRHKVVNSNIVTTRLGQVLGFLLCVGVECIAYTMVKAGQSLVGAGTACAGLAALVLAAIWGRKGAAQKKQ